MCPGASLWKMCFVQSVHCQVSALRGDVLSISSGCWEFKGNTAALGCLCQRGQVVSQALCLKINLMLRSWRESNGNCSFPLIHGRLCRGKGCKCVGERLEKVQQLVQYRVQVGWRWECLGHRSDLCLFSDSLVLATCSEKSFPSMSSLLEWPPGLWTSMPWLSRIVASWRKRMNREIAGRAGKWKTREQRSRRRMQVRPVILRDLYHVTRIQSKVEGVIFGDYERKQRPQVVCVLDCSALKLPLLFPLPLPSLPASNGGLHDRKRGYLVPTSSSLVYLRTWMFTLNTNC